MIVLLLYASSLHAADSSFLASLEKRSQQWNSFVENLYALHQQRLQGRNYYTEESEGGYGGLTNDLSFYKETKYFESNPRQPLALVQLERKNPKNIHSIDVYIYDELNRIKREYSATYLPLRRASPLETVITLHAYPEGLHSLREFDASNILFYEQCTDAENKNKALFAFHYEDIPDSYEELDESKQASYRACFEPLEQSAAAYLNPLVELAVGN